MSASENVFFWMVLPHSNRFSIEQKFLVALSVVNFPEEHWDPDQIQARFCKLVTLVDIDPAYLGDNNSVLQVVLARRIATVISNDQYLGNPSRGARGSSLGTAFTVEMLRICPREE